jgi:hypothetical protein
MGKNVREAVGLIKVKEKKIFKNTCLKIWTIRITPYL